MDFEDMRRDRSNNLLVPSPQKQDKISEKSDEDAAAKDGFEGLIMGEQNGPNQKSSARASQSAQY